MSKNKQTKAQMTVYDATYNLLRTLGLAAGLAMICTAPAWAMGQDLDKLHPGSGGGGGSAKAPEIDPAGLGAAASLLIGGAFLLKGRGVRRRNAE